MYHSRHLLPIIVILCLLLPLPACTAAPLLTSYTAATGYTYLTLGRYPQTAEGEIRPILWRVLRVDGEKAY